MKKNTIMETAIRNLTIEYIAMNLERIEHGERYVCINEYLHKEEIKALVQAKEWTILSTMLLDFFKVTDSGRFGKVWEIVTKLYLNGYKGNSCIVSAKGKVDVTYKGKRIEVKSNCGEIGADFERNDLIIYTMDNKRDISNPANGKVMTPALFMDLMEREMGLIRYNKKNKAQGRVVSRAIQSYANSKRKSSALAIKLMGYKTTAELKSC